MKALIPLLSPKWKHGSELGFKFCFDWELLWKDLTTVNKFSADDKCPWVCADTVFQSVEQRVPNPAIITWLAITKAPKHVIKGLKLNFQNSLVTYLQEQIHTTNFLWQMKLTCQFNNHRHLKENKLTKISHLHEQISFATENLLVCMGLCELGCTSSQAGRLNIQK